MIGSITLKDIPGRVVAAVVLMCMGVVGLVNLYAWHSGIHLRGLTENLILSGVALGCTIIVVALHEGLHGLAFRSFGGDVSFGVRWKTKWGPVPWASSSKLFPRLQSQAIALAPQVLTIGLLAVFLVGDITVVARWLCLVLAGMNLCGGFFDMYVAKWLSRYDKGCLVKDTQDGVQVFAPIE